MLFIPVLLAVLAYVSTLSKAAPPDSPYRDSPQGTVPQPQEASPSEVDRRLAEAASLENRAVSDALLTRQEIKPLVDKALASLRALRDHWLEDVRQGLTWSRSPFFAGLPKNKELNAVMNTTQAHYMILRALVTELQNPPPPGVDSESFVRSQSLLIQDLKLHFMNHQFPTVEEQKIRWKAGRLQAVGDDLSVSVALGMLAAIGLFIGALIGIVEISPGEPLLWWLVKGALKVTGGSALIFMILIARDFARHLRTDWNAVARWRQGCLENANFHYSNVVAQAIVKNYHHPLVAALAGAPVPDVASLTPTVVATTTTTHPKTDADAECELTLYGLSGSYSPANGPWEDPTGVRVDLSNPGQPSAEDPTDVGSGSTEAQANTTTANKRRDGSS